LDSRMVLRAKRRKRDYLTVDIGASGAGVLSEKRLRPVLVYEKVVLVCVR
jgi:hypothetical protein